MGEIADAMIDGELCEECGVYIGPGDGYPRKCKACGGSPIQAQSVKKEKCPVCGKRKKNVTAHMRAVHPTETGPKREES